MKLTPPPASHWVVLRKSSLEDLLQDAYVQKNLSQRQWIAVTLERLAEAGDLFDQAGGYLSLRYRPRDGEPFPCISASESLDWAVWETIQEKIREEAHALQDPVLRQLVADMTYKIFVERHSPEVRKATAAFIERPLWPSSQSPDTPPDEDPI